MEWELKPEEWPGVVEVLPDAITIHDASGRIVWANELAGKLNGGDREGLVGLDCDRTFAAEGFTCPHGRAMTERAGRWAETNLSVGDRRFSIYIAPIQNETGEVSGYLRILRDVTGLESQYSQSLWAERFTTLGQMINGIAHDVGTPLNIISGYAEYLLMRTKPDGVGHKELSTILNQTRRIAEFIKQMLDLARPSKGRIDAIGLKGFLGESLDLMGHHLRKAQVQAVLKCESEPPLIYGDAPRLRQAFFNLLLNACQRVEPDGMLEIVLDEVSGGKGFIAVRITAYDSSGRAMDLSKTFSTFISSKQDGEAAGMGLSLAREILNDFGAQFEVKALPEGGAGLVLYLPGRKEGAVQVMKRDIS